MNKLIEVAEELYKQIDKAQVHLVNARLNNDEEGKKSAISEMETATCNAMQLLKCFIERKDNIVDLGEVWHDKIIKPDENSKIVVISESEVWYNISYAYDDFDDLFGKGWESCVRLYDIVKWAYLKDLLPKGGE